MSGCLIFLGCTSHRQGPRALSQAKMLGLEVILVDTVENIQNTQIRKKEFFEVHEVLAKDVPSCRPLIARLIRVHHVVGIYTFEEFCVEPCAQLSQAFGLPTTSPHFINIIRNKNLCRDALRTAGLPQPISRLCQKREQALDLLKSSPVGDWIIKPSDSAGSQGVYLIKESSIEEMDKGLGKLKPEQRQRFILERFVQGEEFSIEGFMNYGSPVFLGVTKKRVKSKSSFVEDLHAFPYAMPSESLINIHRAITRALQVVELTFGSFHIEFWISDHEVVIGEIHCRPGGDYINLLTELCTGIETYASVFRQFIEPLKAAPIPKIEYRCAAAVNYFNSEPGVITKISGIDDLSKMDGYVLHDITVNVGSLVSVCDQSSHRIGCVVATGKDLDAAQINVQKMVNHVFFETINN